LIGVMYLKDDAKDKYIVRYEWTAEKNAKSIRYLFSINSDNYVFIVAMTSYIYSKCEVN